METENEKTKPPDAEAELSAGGAEGPGAKYETTVIGTETPGWPDPMFVISACQMLQLGATAMTQEGAVVGARLPHPPDIIEIIRETAEKMRDSSRGWSAEKTHPPLEGEGHVTGSDEGEIAFAVGAIHEQGLVVLSFGQAVAWLGMQPSDARMLAGLLNKQADNVDAQAGVAAVPGLHVVKPSPTEPHEFEGDGSDCARCGEGVMHYAHVDPDAELTSGDGAEESGAPTLPECGCGRDQGTSVYAAAADNPDGHATSCPKWGSRS